MPWGLEATTQRSFSQLVNMAYINGIGIISPQHTAEGIRCLSEPINYKGNRISCIEPDYSKHINPVKLRRMSKLLRMGWMAAKNSLEMANMSTPDAIITGTGMGCYTETERFLLSIYENGEQWLPATPFMQSAHSTIGSQIAMMSGCNAYNMTYSHRGFSFESALMDALMLFMEDKHPHILCGGIDEMADNQFGFQNRIGRWKKEEGNSLELAKSQSPGTISGEGSAYFLLGKEKTPTTMARLNAAHTFHKPKNQIELKQNIGSFLASQKLNAKSIDVLICGINGDVEADQVYHYVRESLFNQSAHVYFKHLCGEYPTASSFGLWLAAAILKSQHIPEICSLNQTSISDLKYALLYNHYKGDYHSLMLLSR